MHWIKNSAAWVLLGFLLTVGAGRASSFVHGSGQLVITAPGQGVFEGASAVTSSRSFLDACACCAESADLSRDSAHSDGRPNACCGNGTSADETADETAESGCGRCPANACGGCCEQEYSSLFLSESVSQVNDPGRLPAVLPEDWSAAQRTLPPLLQPPRGA